MSFSPSCLKVMVGRGAPPWSVVTLKVHLARNVCKPGLRGVGRTEKRDGQDEGGTDDGLHRISSGLEILTQLVLRLRQTERQQHVARQPAPQRVTRIGEQQAVGDDRAGGVDRAALEPARG